MNHPPMNILLVIPSTRTQCQGLSAVAYARRLHSKGHRVLLLYHLDRRELDRTASDPFPSIPLRWEGRHLAADIKRTVAEFAPAIIHVWDMWSHGLTAALECAVVSNARLILHQEDDLLKVWGRQKGPVWSRKPFEAIFAGINDKAGLLGLLKSCDLDRYFSPDWAPQNPDFDPLLFFMATRAASAFTAIWHPMKNRLEEAFHKPVLLLPPGFEAERPSLDSAQAHSLRHEVLESLHAPASALLFGAGGSIRHFDNELGTLFQAFRMAAKQNPNLYLAVWGFDTDPALTRSLIQNHHLSSRVALLGQVDDAKFAALQQAADIHVCAGFDSDFNTCRLPSRLCRIFWLGKPLLLHRAGFGESLAEGEEAVLTHTNTAGEWAEKLLALAQDEALRDRLSQGARHFAEQHFDMDVNTEALLAFYGERLYRAPEQETGDAHSRAAARLRLRLEEAGVRRIALYGAGLHTQRLIRQGWLKDLDVVAILDDHPQAPTLEGIPVLDTKAPVLPVWEVLVISSDTHEPALLEKARARGWTPVWGLYTI